MDSKREYLSEHATPVKMALQRYINIVAFVLLVVTMGAPFWASTNPIESKCKVYIGPWGVYATGFGCEPFFEEGYTTRNFNADFSGAFENWRAGTAVAFVFGFFAAVAKMVAYEANSPTKIQLGVSFLFGTIATIGTIVSIAGFAQIEDTDAEDFSACFVLQVVALALLAVSVVLDLVFLHTVKMAVQRYINIVAFVLLVVTMGAPFWAQEHPIGGACEVYSGPWGVYTTGCENVFQQIIRVEDGYTTRNSDTDFSGAFENWRGGTAVAFVFGFFAAVAKTVAYKANSPTEIQLGVSLLFGTIATIGTIVSIAGFAQIEDNKIDFDFSPVDPDDFFVCFALQVIALALLAVSVVLDLVEFLHTPQSMDSKQENLSETLMSGV